MAYSTFADPACSFYQQCSQMCIARFGNPKPVYARSTGMLSWSQSKEGSEDVSLGEAHEITGLYNQ